MRDLRGGVELDLVVTVLPIGQHRTRLDGHGNQPLIHELVADDYDVVSLFGGCDGGTMILEIENAGPPISRQPRQQNVRLEVVVNLYLI